MSDQRKNTKKLPLVIIMLLIAIVTVLIWLLLGNKATSPSGNTSVDGTGSKSAQVLTACTNTLSDQPAMLAGWKTSLYAAPLQDDSSNDNIPDNGARSFSINGIKNKTDANSIYYRIQKTDNSEVAGSDIALELCNTDNKAVDGFTTATLDGSPTSANAVARVGSLHGSILLPEAIGQYRIDAYTYINGSWHFTNRIDQVTLTQ